MYGINYWDEDMSATNEELDVIDPLKALVANQQHMQRLREQKHQLVFQAVEDGYSYTKIAAALNQTEAAVRMYVRRHK